MNNSLRYILLAIGVVIILLILWDGLRRRRKQEKEAPIRTIDLKKVKLKPREPVLKTPEADNEINAYGEGIIGEPRIVNLKLNAREGRETHEADAELIEIDSSTIKDNYKKPLSDRPLPSRIEAVAKPPLELGDFVILQVKTQDKPFQGYRLLQVLLANDLQHGKHQFFHRYLNNDSAQTILFSVSHSNAPGAFELTKMAGFECDALVFFMRIDQHKNALKVFDEMYRTSNEVAEKLQAKISYDRNQACSAELVERIRDALARRAAVTA